MAGEHTGAGPFRSPFTRAAEVQFVSLSRQLTRGCPISGLLLARCVRCGPRPQCPQLIEQIIPRASPRITIRQAIRAGTQVLRARGTKYVTTTIEATVLSPQSCRGAPGSR